MAIIFNTDILQNQLHFSHQNNVVVISTDAVLPKKPLKLEIVINGDLFIIYPSPVGMFYYNFYQVIKALINTKNFQDDADLDLSVSNLINAENGFYLETEIGFKVIYSDTTEEIIGKSLKWILGCLQIDDYKKRLISIPINAPMILSGDYLKYFEGYPFDLSIYTGASSLIKMTNDTNLLFSNLPQPSKLSRVVFSDGRTDGTILDELSISNGINRMKITSNDLDVYFDLEKESACGDGLYLKWLNNLGGWSYWLFKKHNVVRTSKDLGDIQNDYYNPIETISPVIAIGKSSKDNIKTSTGIISEKEKDLISTVLDSPKIYLFQGLPFARNNFNNWMEVGLKTPNFTLKNAKKKNYEINIELELPERNTLTL
jgi:hypothetical protein